MPVFGMEMICGAIHLSNSRLVARIAQRVLLASGVPVVQDRMSKLLSPLFGLTTPSGVRYFV